MTDCQIFVADFNDYYLMKLKYNIPPSRVSCAFAESKVQQLFKAKWGQITQ